MPVAAEIPARVPGAGGMAGGLAKWRKAEYFSGVSIAEPPAHRVAAAVWTVPGTRLLPGHVERHGPRRTRLPTLAPMAPRCFPASLSAQQMAVAASQHEACTRLA